MKTIGIVGTRRRDSNADYILTNRAVLNIIKDGDWLVSGGCPKGGDRFAEMIRDNHGFSMTIHAANWGLHGRSAGFKRNGFIARDADILIAVVNPDRKGGTEDTIRKFLKKLNLDEATAVAEGLLILV